MAPEPVRRLIVNADDFGASDSVNAAVIRAHREGILTTASLMVNEPGFDEAVAFARQNPTLGVGLHLSLLIGKAALTKKEIPRLVDASGRFTNNPVAAGLRYFFQPGIRAELEKEIRAQFEKFHATGLKLDHVNGHLHLHMHPTVFGILRRNAAKLGIRHIRVTREPFWTDAFLFRGRRLYRTSHGFIFYALSSHLRLFGGMKQFRHADRVYGLLQNEHVDEACVLKILPRLRAGDSELYSHPSLDKFKHEFDALVSPRVKELVNRLGLRLIRYQDL